MFCSVFRRVFIVYSYVVFIRALWLLELTLHYGRHAFSLLVHIIIRIRSSLALYLGFGSFALGGVHQKEDTDDLYIDETVKYIHA